ncbi:MAG TPA: hypothetical protein VNA17_06865 [Pyrinomonadaceae bacterium]|nr:hypothetical protein [Pyrinomonadaceae bacterium]
MKALNLKKLAAMSVLGAAAILGTSEVSNAQGRDNNRRGWEDRKDDRQDRKIDRQQERIRLQKARIEQARLRAEQQRILAEQSRRADWNRRNTRSGNDRSNGNGYYNGNANANTNRIQRYRVNRNGAYYNTDQRGVELLRHAVNAGYQQGFQAGRNDYSNRRRVSYANSNIYQSGTYGYQSHVSQSQYQHYFREGFQRGYQDGSNSRYINDNRNGQYNNGYSYDQQYQYGSSSGGVVSILGTILGQILNIQQY